MYHDETTACSLCSSSACVLLPARRIMVNYTAMLTKVVCSVLCLIRLLCPHKAEYGVPQASPSPQKARKQCGESKGEPLKLHHLRMPSACSSSDCPYRVPLPLATPTECHSLDQSRQPRCMLHSASQHPQQVPHTHNLPSPATAGPNPLLPAHPPAPLPCPTASSCPAQIRTASGTEAAGLALRYSLLF